MAKRQGPNERVPNEMEEGEAWERQTMPPDRDLDAYKQDEAEEHDEAEDLITQSDARETVEGDEVQMPKPQRGKKHVVRPGDTREDAGAKLDWPSGPEE